MTTSTDSTSLPRFAARRGIGLATALAALGLAACGGDPAPISAPPTTVAAAAPAEAAPAAAAPAPAAGSVTSAAIGTTALGDALVGPNGMTLYGFTNDAAAASTCYDACAEAWPPLIVDSNWNVAPGLDLGIFATTVRTDGQLQLVAGKYPLYYFSGDVVPGDAKGQGSGDVWFAVGTDGLLLEGDAAASSGSGAIETTLGVVTLDIGDVLTDPNGLSLYGFTEDTDGVPSCDGACADAWPPVLVESPELPADLDPAVFSVAQRSDGSLQLVAGAWPLYRFAGDSAPGDINGQASGGVWFAAAPDGSLIR